MSIIRIAVIESPNPIDLFEGTSEADGLVSACKLIGHQGVSFLAKSRREFSEICQYLASADTIHASRHRAAPLFLHLSCHGNDQGISFGNDRLTWKNLVQDIEVMLGSAYYKGNFALSISSCGSGEHDIDDHILNVIDGDDSIKIPQYIFSIPGCTINWDDALVGWVLFYHKLSAIDIGNRTEVQKALQEIYAGTGLIFSYHRWDEGSSKYKTYKPKKQKVS